MFISPSVAAEFSSNVSTAAWYKSSKAIATSCIVHNKNITPRGPVLTAVANFAINFATKVAPSFIEALVIKICFNIGFLLIIPNAFAAFSHMVAFFELQLVFANWNFADGLLGLTTSKLGNLALGVLEIDGLLILVFLGGLFPPFLSISSNNSSICDAAFFEVALGFVDNLVSHLLITDLTVSVISVLNLLKVPATEAVIAPNLVLILLNAFEPNSFICVFNLVPKFLRAVPIFPIFSKTVFLR